MLATFDYTAMKSHTPEFAIMKTSCGPLWDEQMPRMFNDTRLHCICIQIPRAISELSEHDLAWCGCPLND